MNSQDSDIGHTSDLLFNWCYQSTGLGGALDVTSDQTKYVVIGAGLVGAATAWQLATSGHEVTIVDRGVPADRAGSSHGSARIFRYAYASELYTGLAVRARDLWTELEHKSGHQLIKPTGALDFGTRHDPVGLARVLEGSGVDHQLLSVAEASARWPGIAFDSRVLWQPGAGVIDSEGAVQSMVELACRAGASLRTDWEVTKLERTARGLLLTNHDGDRLGAHHVVLAVGAWLPHLLTMLPLPSSFTLAMPSIHVRQEQPYHFPYRDEATAWPSFIHKTEHAHIYSLQGGRDANFRGQKVAEFNGGKRLRSALEQDGKIDPVNRRRVVDYVERHLPGLDPDPYAETTCLFTSTATADFLIDRCNDITVVSACSGHGAKFAPLTGVLASGVATATSEAAGRSLVPNEFLVGWHPADTDQKAVTEDAYDRRDHRSIERDGVVIK